jgi:hypothetical protein
LKPLLQLKVCQKTFPRAVRGTADPSASLGMTKGRAALPFRFNASDAVPLYVATKVLQIASIPQLVKIDEGQP